MALVLISPVGVFITDRPGREEESAQWMMGRTNALRLTILFCYGNSAGSFMISGGTCG